LALIRRTRFLGTPRFDLLVRGRRCANTAAINESLLSPCFPLGHFLLFTRGTLPCPPARYATCFPSLGCSRLADNPPSFALSNYALYVEHTSRPPFNPQQTERIPPLLWLCKARLKFHLPILNRFFPDSEVLPFIFSRPFPVGGFSVLTATRPLWIVFPNLFDNLSVASALLGTERCSLN